MKGGMKMGYWDATDNIKRKLGGNPICPIHKTEMTPQDDHGRFICWECGLENVHDLGHEERGFTIHEIKK
jgi:hypothetical protein